MRKRGSAATVCSATTAAVETAAAGSRRTGRWHRRRAGDADVFRRRTVWVLVAALVGLATGCGAEEGSSSQLPSPSTGKPGSAAPSTTVDPQDTPILTAYEEFIRAANEAANLADPDHPALAETADGQALIQTQRDIRDSADSGRRYTGQIVIVSARVSELDLDVAPPMPAATVDSCWNISDYVLVDEAGMPVPVQRDTDQFVVTAKLRHIPDDDRWIVVVLESDMEQPC